MRFPIVLLTTSMLAFSANAQSDNLDLPGPDLPGLETLKAALPEPVFEPGTDAGADELRAAIVPYITEDAFESGLVSIAPVEEGYRIDLDFTPFIDAAREDGDETFKIDISNASMLVSEQPDGQWYVSSSGPLNLSMALNELPEMLAEAQDMPQAFEYVIDGLVFEGFYDPKIANYSDAYVIIGKTRQVQRSAIGDIVTTTEPLTMRLTGTESDIDGRADVQIVQVGGAQRQEMPFPLDPENPDVTIPAVFSIGSATSATVGEAVVGPDTLKLYTVGIELIRNPDREGLLTDIKSALNGALPLWDRLDTEARISGIDVEVEGFGSGRIGALDFDLYLDGIEADGAYSIVYDMSEISAESTLIPPWADDLIPTDVKFVMSASGVNLADPAALTIANLRLDWEAPLPPETLSQIAASFGNSNATFGLGDSSVTGKDYSLEYSAAFEGGDIMVQVEAVGLDTVIASLQEAGQEFPEAMQGVSFLQIAKGFGQPTGKDDQLQWTVALGADGSVTVNGAMLKGPDPEPLPGNPQFDLDAAPPTGDPSDPL